MKKHVHCYDSFPDGDLQVCMMAELEPDTEVVHDGVTYRPVLTFKKDCLVIERDRVRAFVATPGLGDEELTGRQVRDLIGAGAGPITA